MLSAWVCSQKPCLNFLDRCSPDYVAQIEHDHHWHQDSLYAVIALK